LNPTVPETVPVHRKLNLPAPVPEASVPDVLFTAPPEDTLTVLLLPTVKVPELKLSVVSVKPEPKVTPPLPLIVKAFTVPVNKDEGKVMPLVLVKVTPPDALLALIVPLDLVIDEPE